MLQHLADAAAADLVRVRSKNAKLRRLNPTTKFLGTSNCEAKARPATWLISGAATAAALFSSAHAADPSSDPYGLWKPLEGAIYKFHSGIVADRAPPTANERRLTILVDGKAAKDIFESIGPDYAGGRAAMRRGTGIAGKKAWFATTPRRTRRTKTGPIDAGSV